MVKQTINGITIDFVIIMNIFYHIGVPEGLRSRFVRLWRTPRDKLPTID